MNKAVKFYHHMLGLQLKVESPGWSEFVTGESTLALHPASEKNPAGKVELGFAVADAEAFCRDMSAKGVLFSMPPKKQDFGGVLAQFVDSEGAHCSLGAAAAQSVNVLVLPPSFDFRRGGACCSPVDCSFDEPRQKRSQHRRDEHVGSRQRSKARLNCYTKSRGDNGELAACNEFDACS
jgi:predicted enzyme related to lactoylglutathione lyase